MATNLFCSFIGMMVVCDRDYNVRDSKKRLAESRQEVDDVLASINEKLFASRRVSYPDLAKEIAAKFWK